MYRIMTASTHDSAGEAVYIAYRKSDERVIKDGVDKWIDEVEYTGSLTYNIEIQKYAYVLVTIIRRLALDPKKRQYVET